MHVLIAEDDLTSRIALAGVLKKNGHEVVAAVNGREAWQALQLPDAPLLVILDWMMPEMDGLEVVRRVRALQAARPPYIILLTAKGEKSDIIAGLESGANDYLAKPFDAGELLARVKVGCRMIAMQDALSGHLEALRHSEQQHRILLEKSADAIFSCTPEGKYEYVNSAFAREAGRTVDDIVGQVIGEVLSGEGATRCLAALAEVCRSGEELVLEIHRWLSDVNRCHLTTLTPIKDQGGRVTSVLFSAKDITERKRMETYREMGREILQTLNQTEGLASSIQRTLEILKTGTAFDAVGIRLQEGDDYPYVAHQGFPQDFFLTENTLLGRTIDGGVCRQENGDLALECTCGLVISGTIEANAPFFTGGGSFWTNDSLSLLDIPPDQDPRFQPRNQCIHHNYASVALVPIRNQGRIIGLLHFNDQRKGRFTLEAVEALEGIASHVGAALIRKQAEEALEAERKRLTDIIEFLPDATLALDSEGRVIIWNRAMETMTGVPAEEMVGKGEYAYALPFYGEARQQLIDLVLAEDEEVAALYPDISREGDTLTTEVFCKALYNNTGAWVFAKASPLCDRDGIRIGAIESIRDITYSKQMEEKLKKNIAWFKALFNATADSVMLVNPDGVILDLNNIAALRRNLSTEAMKGRNVLDFLPQESAVIRTMAMQQIVNERALIQYDEARSDKHYRVRLFPVTDDQGGVVQVASFSRDITENKHTEEEKKKLRAQLIHVQKMEALGTLAGGVAHDFNNLLGAIIGYVEMARCDSPEGSNASLYLTKVLEASNRATDLAKQILTFSRRNDTERRSINPANLVKETIRLLRPSLPSTIVIKTEIETTTRPILADPTQFQQILMNLCVNAFHAMEQTGGTLEIGIQERFLTQQDLLHRPEIQPGRFVELTVTDSGVGINPEIQHKIFDPYFTTKEVGKGTGMGLSILHGLVTSYGGFVTVASEPGKGTAFHVFFPTTEQKATLENYVQESVPGGREHILFVDDEEILAELGKTMLTYLGYTATACTSSLEAYAFCQQHPERFDAVITDQTMPGMTGSLFAEKVLQLRSDLPIILCTGNLNHISEEEARSKGIKKVILKPLAMRELASLIRQVLDHAKAQRNAHDRCASEASYTFLL